MNVAPALHPRFRRTHSRRAAPRCAARSQGRGRARRAGGRGPVRLAETLEHVRQKRRRNSGARIANPMRMGVARQRDLDRAALRRELDRVGEQIPDDLMQARAVACDARRRSAPRRPRRSLRGRRWRVASIASSITSPSSTGPVDAKLPGDDARDVEQISDELGLRSALRSIASRPRAAVAPSIRLPQQGDPCEHGLERRAQLMREHAEELVLHPVGLARLGGAFSMAIAAMWASCTRTFVLDVELAVALFRELQETDAAPVLRRHRRGEPARAVSRHDLRRPRRAPRGEVGLGRGAAGAGPRPSSACGLARSPEAPRSLNFPTGGHRHRVPGVRRGAGGALMRSDDVAPRSPTILASLRRRARIDRQRRLGELLELRPPTAERLAWR